MSDQNCTTHQITNKSVTDVPLVEFIISCIYSHARRELPQATQVFVVFMCDVFRALINSLVC